MKHYKVTDKNGFHDGVKRQPKGAKLTLNPKSALVALGLRFQQIEEVKESVSDSPKTKG